MYLRHLMPTEAITTHSPNSSPMPSPSVCQSPQNLTNNEVPFSPYHHMYPNQTIPQSPLSTTASPKPMTPPRIPPNLHSHTPNHLSLPHLRLPAQQPISTTYSPPHTPPATHSSIPTSEHPSPSHESPVTASPAVSTVTTSITQSPISSTLNMNQNTILNIDETNIHQRNLRLRKMPIGGYIE